MPRKDELWYVFTLVVVTTTQPPGASLFGTTDEKTKREKKKKKTRSTRGKERVRTILRGPSPA